MDQPLHPRVENFQKKQFECASALDIQRADLVYGAAKAGTERSKPATKATKKERQGKSRT
ncbi:hypothetical protein PM082_018529 [Marasmius tenuissimus]|nr:hypothetical protein PM082_018529 [Marasmius tenuissimus]